MKRIIQGIFDNFNAIITPAINHASCHAGLDPASSTLDSRFLGNDKEVFFRLS
jgi:hypothetical protein